MHKKLLTIRRLASGVAKLYSHILENWIQQNLTETNKKGSSERAKELADKCIAEAAATGITIDDMEPEWGSVETIIYETMQNNMDAELEFWKAWAVKRDRKGRLH